jgi:hypothetical protein
LGDVSVHESVAVVMLLFDNVGYPLCSDFTETHTVAHAVNDTSSDNIITDTSSDDTAIDKLEPEWWRCRCRDKLNNFNRECSRNENTDNLEPEWWRCRCRDKLNNFNRECPRNEHTDNLEPEWRR